MSKVFSMLAVLALVLATTPVWDGGPCDCHGRGGPGGPGMGSGMDPGKLEALSLSAQQRQQVAALEAAQLQKVTPIRTQLGAKRSEMRVLWDAQSPDRKAILAKQAEMDALRKQLREFRVDFKLELLKVLTVEQKASLQAKDGAGGCDCAGPGGCGCQGGKPGDCGCQGGCGKHRGHRGGLPI
jgi:Spy/CpxP family protein refolding chaperone